MPVVSVTAVEFDTFARGAKRDYRDYLVANIDSVLAKYFINRSGLRLSHFMAQIGHECDLFKIRREDLSYTSVERLLEIFGPRHSAKITPEEAPGLLRQPRKLAERVYGLGNPRKAKELGNTEKGDGFKFRGAGFLQITGRDSFTRHGRAIGVDLTVDSDLAAEAANSLFLACEEWKEKKCNKLADADDVVAVTRAVNGGTNGMAERRRLLKAAKALWENKKAN